MRLIEVGPSHTPGDLIAWVPDARVAIAADILFIGVTPIMWAGPVENWIAALERLLALGAERFVPGHGPVCGPEEVRRLLDYWRWLDAAARQRLDAGMSAPETARDIVLGGELAEHAFADWLAPERALISVADHRCPPPRHRAAGRPTGPDHGVLPHGTAGAGRLNDRRPPGGGRRWRGVPGGVRAPT